MKLVFTRPFGPAYIRLHVAKYTKECASSLRHTKTCTNESVSYLSIYCALLCVRKREKYLEGTGLGDEYRILISDTMFKVWERIKRQVEHNEMLRVAVSRALIAIVWCE